MSQNNSNNFVSNDENNTLFLIENNQITFINGYRGQQFEKIISKLPPQVRQIKVPSSFTGKIPSHITQKYQIIREEPDEENSNFEFKIMDERYVVLSPL